MSTPDDASGDGERDEAQDDAIAGAGAAKAKTDATPKQSKKAKKADKKGLFARFGLFLRQVMAELRKVIWPTRSELINYTTVVIIFVVVMALILAAYDFVFAKGVFFVFTK